LQQRARHRDCSIADVSELLEPNQQPNLTMRATSILFLVVGIILLVFGLNAGDSFASEVSETFTGNPTDRSMWLLIGGAALTVIGGVGLMRGRKS
tara:strand:- start:419 stop:703 length:285 start_codon:yes stop_codon:yes gene_type:complete